MAPCLSEGQCLEMGPSGACGTHCLLSEADGQSCGDWHKEHRVYSLMDSGLNPDHVLNGNDRNSQLRAVTRARLLAQCLAQPRT